MDSKNQDGGYRVTTRSGCHIIMGAVPVTHMAALLNTAPPDAVADAQIADRLGAALVYGAPDDCRRLREEMEIGRPPGPEMADAPIEEKIQHWLEHGEVGVSSKAIAYRMLGQTRKSVINDMGHATHPRDPGDFRRCQRLIDDIPEIRNRLDEMREMSPVWDRLVDEWGELAELLAIEMEQGDSAPRLYARMKELGC